MRPSQQHAIARELITHLQGDIILKPYIFAEVWCSANQPSKIKAAASKYSGVVAVTVQIVGVKTQESGRINAMRPIARLGVMVMVAAKAAKLPADTPTESEFIAALTEAVLDRLRDWKYGNPQSWTEPGVGDPIPTDFSNVADLANNTAVTIPVTMEYVLKKNTPNQ